MPAPGRTPPTDDALIVSNGVSQPAATHSPLIIDISPQCPYQPPCTLQTDVQAARAVADVEPGVVASAVLVAHQAELDGGRMTLDGASIIGAALQGNAGHEGWSGFVDVVVCPIWYVSIVADAPDWAAGWYRLTLVVFCLWLHWSPLPCPLVCGGAVRGRVKLIDRDRGSGRTDG